jgi:hypothetical protein
MSVTRAQSSLCAQHRPDRFPRSTSWWITAGLGCDGDTIAMTAATQPSTEDIVRGFLPWIPKVTLHNP